MTARTAATSPGSHLLFLYASENERVHGLARWVVEGLACGERVVVVDGRDDDGPGLLGGLLSAGGQEVRRAARDGRLSRASLLRLCPGPDADSLAREVVDGVAAARLTTQVSDALPVLGERRFVDVEDCLEDLCRRYPLSALCQYERPAAAGERLMRAAALHDGGVVDTLLRATLHEDALDVAGEVDVTNAHVLHTLVETVSHGAGEVLRVDLSGLGFLSASGCRALLDGTAAFRAAGGVLRLVGARPNVYRVVTLAGLGAGVELTSDSDA